MKVSIVMRAKNSDWVIGEALAALHAQTLSGFELLVVDSGSTDRTLEIARRYPCRLRQIPASDYFPGPVLNAAIRETSGDVIVFQNSDVVPLVPDALERLVAAVSAPGVDAAFARQVPRPEAHLWVRRDHAVAFPAQGPAPAWMPFSLPFAAMRRSSWRAHNFYTDAWGSEDTEWGVWAGRHDRVVTYVPEAKVMHSHNYTLRELIGRRFIEGEADAFIHRGADSVFRMVARTARSIAADVAAHAAAGDLRGMLASVPRRAVYHAAYYRGHRHGERRRVSSDRDATLGQRMVLEWYGGAAAREAR